MKRVIPALALIFIFAAATEFRTLTFDRAAEGLLIRSMPLKVTLPYSYTLVKDQPQFGTRMWTTPASHEFLKQNGHASPDDGVFQIRITTNLAYDRAANTFFCGPGCTESTLLSQIAASGATEVKSERKVANGIPILLIEAKMPAMAGFGPSKVYLAYLATLIDTNVVLLSFTPSTRDPAGGERAWRALRKTLLENSK